MVTKLINQLIITSVLCSINLIAYGEIMDLKGEYYEKNGCIYLIGHPTKEEKAEDLKLYKERKIKREAQVNAEIQRNHEIKIEKIRAIAISKYAKYQEFLYQERTRAIVNQSRSYAPRITLKSIKGEQGIQGEKGNTGTIGSTGTTGATGVTGSQGNIGSVGAQGVQGTIGEQGIQGSDGDPRAYFSNLSVYDHNPGAIANGGLSPGDYYRTSEGTLRIVY